MHYTPLKRGLGLILFLLLSLNGAAQQPDWNRYADVKERLTAMRKYGFDLIRKQQYDQAVSVLNTGVALAKQATLDSFVSADLALVGAAYRFRARYDSAFIYYDHANKIAVQNKYTSLQAFILTERYAIFNRTGKADSAAAVIRRMQDLLPELDSNSNENAKIEMYLGHDDKHKTKYTEALQHYHNALRIFGYVKDSVNQGTIYVSLANVLVLLGQPDQALSYHRQAAYLFRLMHRKVELVNEYLNIADLYMTSVQMDSAESYVRQSLPIVEALKDTGYLANVYVDLGYIYKQRKRFDETKTYFLQAIRYSAEAANDAAMLDAYQGMGEMYMADNKPELAAPYLEKHLALAKQERNREEIIEASSDLAENEHAMHHYEKAYAYQKLYNTYRDSAYTESTAKSMAEMESKYQAEKKGKEIDLLKKDQQLGRLNLQKQKNFQAGAVIFLSLLLLIAFLIINRYRILQRSKRLIEMERMRNAIARDLHDDIGSTLSSINILSKVALQQQANEGVPTDLNMKKIKDRSAAIMESMGDIVWAINPRHDSIEQMLLRMKEFTAEILEPLNIHFVFKINGDLSAIKLDIEKRKDFYLLFKEAVNNAAKYSACRNVTIDMRQEQRCLYVRIEDDGKGFDEAAVKNGNGLINMRERAASMKAGIRIDSSAGKGTKISVDVPIS